VWFFEEKRADQQEPVSVSPWYGAGVIAENDEERKEFVSRRINQVTFYPFLSLKSVEKILQLVEPV
jgi:hypothetical protein